ncbi:MAG: tRNA uridine(34) 5-carboxymethylaminomethyl modification radical SAM/GNAT enzyme Elp3 [Dehalococcoidia bacterium]|nr:MAG: tRNA uridine(34) 5-carboxymethylaminomethyl modification radical SAM/GNAT enzyme Elp3 [Dehalococcoidia bacterium]
MRKGSRTISGVTPVAVMARPMPCPGSCVFCPSFDGSPKSYTPESPAVLRALSCEYDPARQVEFRLNIFSRMGHPVDKVEIIVMGGTFLASPPEYQFSFIKSCYDALNGHPSHSLEDAKRANETARYRCVGLCIETRPDWCSEDDVRRMLEFGTTRVELGVQTLDDDIYRLVRRGHGSADVADATALLKRHGLKVYYHWMPGLPGSTPSHDLELARLLFDDDRYKPDGIKIYPTLVVAGTELEQWYREGKYTPYSVDEMVGLIADIKNAIPGYVRIPRVMRDIPTRFIVAGCRDLSLRSSIREVMKAKGMQCRCTRCREYGHRRRDGWKTGEPSLHRWDYDASGGREIFLSFEDDAGTLFGLLRLRIGRQDIYPALVREIHIFGSEVPIGEQDNPAAQHKGLGSALMKEAERIARDEFAADRIAVISGVGARDYFRHGFGYELEGHYMSKKLRSSI